MLLKDERFFEFKYLKSIEEMDEFQIQQVLKMFKQIFYFNFQTKFKDKQVNFIQSMT